ncbi:hypothetical protein [Streptomyces sp. NPDC093260]|uniref:hypothetical protein n=1 Tax=Streptomyces sp. NPDC093260 TaxID=3155073 RepID=UPI0034478009
MDDDMDGRMDGRTDHLGRFEHAAQREQFEQRLVVLMRDSEQHAPFEPRHRDRLRAGVRARHRARAARRVVGSALAVAGLGLGVALFLPGRPVHEEPGAPAVPRPASVPSAPVPPSTSPSYPPTTAPAPPDTAAAPDTSASGRPTSEPLTAPPPSTSLPATGPVTQSPPDPGATRTEPPPSSVGTFRTGTSPTETSLAGPSGRSAR